MNTLNAMTPARTSQIRTLPVLSLDVAGKPVLPAVLTSLTELRIHSQLGLPSVCELLFAAVPANEEFAAVGNMLGIRAGQDFLFEGEITAVEFSYSPSRGSEVRIRSYDLLQRLRRRQTVRAFQQMTLSTLARELISASGLATGSVDKRADRLPLPHTVQWCGSDFDLLRFHSNQCGLYPVLQDAKVHLRPLLSEAPPVKLRYGSELISANFEINSGSTCTSVQTSVWNPGLAEHAIGKASQSQISLHNPVNRQMLNRAGDPAAADLFAQAEFDLNAARQMIFSGVTEGDARLKLGGRVAIEGVAPKICGVYDLTAVTHRIDSLNGFITEISNKPPASPEEPRGASVAIGLVTQVEDPEVLGRVRVTLPGFDNTESGWLAVVIPGAGSDKGFLALPARGDTVLLLLPEGNPANAVVLGGLYGADRLPYVPGEDGEKQPPTIRIKDAASNRLQFSSNGIALHAEGDLTIEAPGRKIRIVADQIDFYRG